MNKQSEVEKIAELLASARTSDKNVWVHLAEHLVDNGIGSKGRFYLSMTEGIPCGMEIKPIDYKEKDETIT